VRLTAAGATYYEEALRVLAQVERAHTNASRVNEGLEGSIDVGFFASMLYRGLDKAVRQFRQEHPGVGLRLIELSTADQVPALLRRRIQYAFVHTGTLPQDIESEELLREPFVLCLPATHPAASSKRVRLAEFAREEFVLFSRAFSPAYYDQVVSVCVAAGFHPDITHEARHWLTVLACISRGMGITLVPRSLASSEFPSVAFVEVEEHAVRSFIRGAWLHADAGLPALRAWHQTVLRDVKA
jgi:DNA-binding transcriptional LysR family regulator